MDQHGFRVMLEGRKVPPEKLESVLALAERFEQFAAQQGISSTATAWAFSYMLITKGENSEENFITLARYGLFIHNNPIFVAFLEVLDGGEAQENLYNRIAERYGILRGRHYAKMGYARAWDYVTYRFKPEDFPVTEAVPAYQPLGLEHISASDVLYNQPTTLSPAKPSAPRLTTSIPMTYAMRLRLQVLASNLKIR